MSDSPDRPEPPVDRFCDLVMKGGITSGVVYPKAISRLAREYRFRSIGGTSAGAIAAAVTAAAEYRRRQTGTRDGFEILSGLPDELQADVPGTRGTKLLSLFQPQPGTRRLFSVLVRALNRGGAWSRIAAITLGLMEAYWLATAASLVVAVVARWWGLDWIGVVLLLLVALVGSVGLCLYRDLTGRVVANGYGLCTGLTADPKNPALTPWLHELIQRTAGIETKEPLTFGMLWNAADPPQVWSQLRASQKPSRSIDLQMFSTNLGHGRPYIFPLAESDVSADAELFPNRERLFFNADELNRYLPADVSDWMKRKGKPYVANPARGNHEPSTEEARRLGLTEVPEPADFPVILAARMSLSFPFLFAAVPLWSIDYSPPPGQRHFRKCWFSDGGISSNFPMHLFDGLVPRWPTFGINLEPAIKERSKPEDEVYLPTSYREGYGERWDHFDDAADAAQRLGGFVSAILGTMQNWNDNSLARMPGVRDRIARVRLNASEGGLNLNMKAGDIHAVVQRGEVAAEKLIARFSTHTPPAQAPGWDEQRFVRLGTLLKMLAERAPSVAIALDAGCPHATSYANLISQWTANSAVPDAAAPPGYAQPLSQQQADTLRRLVAELERLSLAMDAPGNQTAFHPIPMPELRVRPPL
ncbi:patatin-like phospholipase family protein [Variovorax sp. PAMC26660]|uniref:patatin-like phospholipase family protein n=1 Tax=Variovorax sp. PAMC26660 TaxID=2762322 RepID=UPI00164E587D|nr:patatin-like phospholipase family protein [Variovorax sp. PAMC26660]QNK68749.1 patatin-like phospholipase family protein [Variovorax sp. PAMC26660]